MLEIIESLLLSFFAIAVLLPVIRFALRRLSPSRQNESLTAEEVKYIQKQEFKLTIVYYFFACILSVFSAGMLSLIASIIHNSGNSLFLLTPNFRAMFAPGLLVGLTLALIPLRITQRAFLGQEYELYKSYLRQQEGHNSKRVYALLLLVLLLISGAVGWLATRWHVSINEESLVVTNFLMEKRVYPMQEIQSIHYLGQEGEYLITFNDQTILNTTYLKTVQLEMIALLAQESGNRVIR
ncbi:hypothetical protein ACFSKU_16885 [Pontibacter silvestris]|uniref:DUF5671 domain-containing protein n=1 Tax=Pontibacter silvestris TaxID=2305183 RepID=A0ABW4X0N5_9BACT|nr:hypothetical protein [Pontibacter silvestris]MCC9135699.1 hypothetical protein [Pontibacter silvestris]